MVKLRWFSPSVVPTALRRRITLIAAAAILGQSGTISNADGPGIPPPVWLGGAPPPQRKLPGTTRGEASTCWIAPYALATSYSVGGATATAVRWFDENGGIVQELSGPGLDVRTDYIWQSSGGKNVIHDVHGKWKLVLPDKPGEPGSGYSTAAGDTFVHEFHPEEGQIAADIYVAGKLSVSVGPFVQYKGRDVQLANDGSLALLTWKSAKKEAVQVTVVGPDGKVSFSADCGEDVDSPLPVCGGKAVLVRVTGHEEPPVRFRSFQPGGNWVSFDIGPNASLIAWTANVSTVLFRTAVGDKQRFKLVDCSSGKVVWDIPSPVQYYEGAGSAAVLLDDRFLFVGRDFAAVDIKSGEVVARCQPNSSRSEMGRIVRRGTRLFVVTSEEFTEIDPADIAAKRNGWR